MKTTTPQKPIQLAGPNRIIDLRWISVLAIVLGLAFLIVLAIRSLVSHLVWCDLTPDPPLDYCSIGPNDFGSGSSVHFFLVMGPNTSMRFALVAM